MKRTRNILLTLLLALCALCLAFAFTGCGVFDTGSSSDDGGSSSSSGGNASATESVYGVGEEGTYYYDGADGVTYLLSMQSGIFMVFVSSDTVYGGTYTVDETLGIIYFTSSQRSFVAVMGTDSVQLVMDDGSYTFLRQTSSSGNVATPAESVYGVGEEGTYYYDDTDGDIYMLSLQSGFFMVFVNSDAAYGGTYTVDETKGSIYFTSSQRSFVAVMGTDSVQLVMDDGSYTFLRQTSSSGNVATPTEPTESAYGVGEEGTYYYDGADGVTYLLSMQSGAFMVAVNSDTAYGGTYTVDEALGIIYLTSSQRSFVAVMGTNSVQLVVDGGSFTFLRQTKFDVVFLDADGNEIYRETVVYGRSADEPEISVEGYVFIGWYADENHKTEYSFNTAVTGTTYVYGWYVEELSGDFDFAVTLDYGDGTTEFVETLNGAVYRDLPESHGGKDILGWWVSATNKSSELTARYEYGDVFNSDTTLFAVYDETGVLGASVTESGITWEKYYSANVTVRVSDAEGEIVLSSSAAGSSGMFCPAAFSELETGTYTVDVVSGSVTETLTYVVNGLARVSASTFDVTSSGNTRILRFVGVEGAEGYVVTIDDGKNLYTRDIGNDTYFSGIFEMTECGLTFSVTAYAEGYVSSVSDGYGYLLALGETESITIDNDVVSWTRVEGAASYEITITSGGDVVDVVTTTETQISLKNYDNGTYDISVKAMADGYFSAGKVYYGYGKQTLAAPVITDITSYTVTWTQIDGAVTYIVMIDGSEIVVEGTTLYLTDELIPDAGSFDISVKSMGSDGFDSPYGEAVTVTCGNFSSALTYEKNTVIWNYDVAAAYYSVSVNGVTAEGDNKISFGASHEITLTKAGNNDVTVTAYDKEGRALGSSPLTVFAYEVTLSATTAVPDTPYIYVAAGDVMHLGGASVEHGTFVGWYTLPDLTEGQSDEYTGDGYEIADGSVFTGSSNVIYYAYWTYDYLTVNLMVDNVRYATAEVKYYSTNYSLPVPDGLGAEYDFTGWFASLDGMGTQYTDEGGKSNPDVKYDGVEYMYAFVLQTKSFRVVTYGSNTYCEVSAGSGAASVKTITLPEYYVAGKYYSLVLTDGAFSAATSLEVLNIPDTVLYVAVTHDGYESGTGAFAGLSKLKAVNVYATGEEPDPTKEVTYYSADGVLFRKDGETNEAEIVYYPYAKSDRSYVMPAYVSNEYECLWDGSPVSYPVTTIGARVFRHAKFTEITLPETITHIAAQAFYNNTGLTKVYFADGGSVDLIIENDAFYGCTKVTEVTLPARYSAFNADAFADCSSLLNVYVSGEGGVYTSEEGVLYSENNAAYKGEMVLVYYPQARSGAAVMATGVTVIGEKAFYGNTKITSVSVPSSVKEIGISAFEGCTGIVTLTFSGDANNNDLTIRKRAFYGCSGLTSVSFPQNIYEIDENAFGECTAISYVYIDTRAGTEANPVVLILAENAFGETNYIYTVEFGANVPFIANFCGVFDGGYVQKFIIDEENENYYSDSGVVYDGTKSVLVYFPHGKEGEYKILDTCTNIAEGAFTNRYSLTVIYIGADVNTIPYGTFFGCISLEKIIVDSDNINYGSDEFGILYTKKYNEVTGKYEMYELTYCPTKCVVYGAIVIPDTITSVADSPFYNNTYITSVTFETTSPLTFGDMAFYGCTNLKTVEFNSELVGDVISDYTFYGCSSLKYVKLPTNITEIGEYAFYGCSSLIGDLNDSNSGMKLPEGLEIIGDYAFYNDDSTSTSAPLALTIPSTVVEIGDYAFWGCWNNSSSTAAIVFASSEDENGGADLTIGANAFAYTYYATGVTIPARTIFMGDDVFHDSGNKSSVYQISFEDDSRLTEIGTEAFYYVGTNAGAFSVEIPSSVKSIGYRAFTFSSVGKVTFGEDSELTEIGFRAFYMSKLTTIEIPENVTTISGEAFIGTALASITFLGESLTTIGEKVFQNVETLGSIDIPASVYSIGDNAFEGCTGLKHVTFAGDDETSGLAKIGTECFKGCSSLLTSNEEDEGYEFSLPAEIVTVGVSAFEGCSAMAAVTFPTSTEVISERAFYSCASLAAATFSTNAAGICSIKEIGDNAFYGCVALTSFEFPSTVYDTIEVGTSVFAGSGITTITFSAGVSNLGSLLSGLTDVKVEFGANSAYRTGSDGKIVYSQDGKTIVYIVEGLSGDYGYEILDGVVTIGDYAFSGQTGMTSITIPSSVTSIGEHAFDGCTNLKTVVIEGRTGGNPVSIGGYAFYGCTSLSSVTLPEGITEIPDYAFYQCSLSGTVLPETIRTIGEYAFRKSKINNVYLPNIVTVGAHSFRDDTALVKIEFGDTLEELGQRIFDGCSNLETCILPEYFAVEGPVTLNQYMFYNCSKLTTVNIPENVEVIDLNCFYCCSSLKSVVLPDSVRTINNQGFYKCTSLETCILNEGLETLGQSVFHSCPLTEIVFPDSLTNVGKNSFQSTSLTSIDFNKVTTLGNGVFFGCSNLTDVKINTYLTALPEQTFYQCTSLTQIYTGDSVTSIGMSCFYGCTALTTIEFGPNLTTIDGYVFQACTALTSFVVPSTVTSLGMYAFSNCSGLLYMFIPKSVNSVGANLFRITNTSTYATNPDLKVYIEFSSGFVAEYWTSGWDTDFYGTAYYYSETQPTVGNCWHYVDGVVTEWVYTGDNSSTPTNIAVADIKRGF